MTSKALKSWPVAKPQRSAEVDRPLAKELRPYDTSKGTIRFTVEKPLPAALVTKMVKLRVKENEAAQALREAKRRGR